MADTKYQEGGEVDYEALFPGATVLGPAEGQTYEDLQRSIDLGFLGEAGTDPVGAAQQVPELIRSGELGGDLLEEAREGQRQVSPFPMEPGTSRASQELPEMFGTLEADPEWVARQEQLMQLAQDPEAGFFGRLGAQMQMAGGPGGPPMPQMRFRSSGVGSTLSPKDALMVAAAGMTMYDPAEIAMMLTQVDPETGERKWPEFGIQHAPDGAIIVANNKTGARAVINRPGMSTTDTLQALGLAAAFTPAGRATAAMPSVAGRIAVGATTAGLTEAGIQAGQEAAGGQFDPGDVALTTALGPLIDVGRLGVGGVQRLGRFIGSYIPENLGQTIGMKTGLSSVIPEAKAQVINFTRRARDYLQSGRPAIVTTQDAVPEAHTPFRQILLKMVERLPLTGTGALRKAQQQQRVEVLQHLADRFNLHPGTNYGATVIDDINRNAGGAMEAAVAGRRAAVDQLADTDIIIRDFRLKVRDLIEQETKYGDMANQGLIDLLNKARTSVWVGGVPKPGKLPRGFGIMDDWLQRLRMHAGQGSPQVRATLNEAADALEADLRRHAGDAGEAGANWLRNMDDAARIATEAENRTLQSLINAGEVDQQVIRRVLKGGDADQIGQLYQSMTPEGRVATQQMIMRNALRVGGWRRAMPEEMVVDPDKVVRWLETEPVEAQLRTFFPDQESQQMLGGMQEYLKMTADAAKTGQGVGMAAAGGLPQHAANTMNLVTLGLVGFAGQAYQSAPIRNLLLRLYHVKSDVRLKDAVMRQITPLLMAGGRQTMQQWTEDDPQDSAYVSAEFQDASQERNMLDQAMQELRRATGQEQAEDADTEARMMQQLQEMGLE